VYHAVEGQCDGDYLVTASGAKIKSTDSAYDHRYIAVSRDLLDVFPYGTKVEVSGCGELDGVYTVADTLNKRYKGYIDILINPDMRGGKWEGVRIKKVY
jgi:3D (Asp-Asp-Asp) domain-containing protein